MSDEDDEDTSPRRLCNSSCHFARRAKCNCWCEGLFHGERGKEARAAFIKVFGFLPTQPRDGGLFSRAIQAAKEARG